VFVTKTSSGLKSIFINLKRLPDSKWKMSFYEGSESFQETGWIKRDHDSETTDMENNFIGSQDFK